jgi:hypothetical protein
MDIEATLTSSLEAEEHSSAYATTENKKAAWFQAAFVPKRTCR